MEQLSQDEKNSLALQKLFNNPETGLEAKRLYKKIVPDAKFPDLELADKLAAQEAKMQKEIDDLKDKAQLNEITQRREKHFGEMREKGFDPDAVEKVMTENKIGSYETAMKFMAAQNAVATPTSASMTPIRMPDNVKEIQKNPTQWAKNEAFAAINELKAKRGF
jgi:hypothetical protein